MIIKKSCKVVCVLVICFSQFYFFSNAFASMECGNSRFQDTIYGDFQEAAESACVHQSGSTSVDYIDYLDGGSIGIVHCQSCSNGSCEPWMGWTASCQGNEFYADFSDLDTEDQTNAKSCPSSPNPINLITGNKYKIHADIQNSIDSDLHFRPEFIRTYNSQLFNVQTNNIGNNWRHTYQRYLKIQDSFNTGFNESYASQGQTSNPMQTSVYSSEYSACVEGFQELMASISPYSVLNNIRNGTPRWEKQVCRVYVGGRYVVTIPIRSHSAGGIKGPVAQHSIKLYRQNGRVLHFIKDLSKSSELNWKSADPLVENTLEQILIEDVTEEDRLLPYFQSESLESIFKYTDENEIVEIYNNKGELLRIEYPNGAVENLTYIYINTVNYTGDLLSKVENNFGKYIEFGYDAEHRIQSVTNDENNVWSYSYDLQENLSVVNNPDGTEKIYHYENSQYPYLLTGETDERGIRYSSFIYQSDGRAKISYLGAPDSVSEQQIERVTVAYGGGRNNRVTDSRGNKTTYHFPKKSIQGLVTKIDGPDCNYCSTPDVTYDYNTDYIEHYFNTEPVFLMSKIEFGSKTVFGEYNPKNNPGFITEAEGTAEERQKGYTYDDRFSSKIATIAEASVYPGAEKVTSYSYDDFSNVTSIKIDGFTPVGTPVSRQTSFEYNGPFHQLKLIDGPRNDVSDIIHLNYYPDDASQGPNRARLRSVLSHDGMYIRNTVQYTLSGKIKSELRLNDLYIEYTYYPGNDRLKDFTQTDATSSAIRTVRYTYLATGEVESITQGADSSNPVTLTLSYDNARRLTRITDGLNNYIEYILDTEGNVENENIYDASGNLKKTLAQTFDSYNRLENFTQVNEGKTVDFNPDGTINTVTDGKGVLTDYSYDNLKRLSTITQDKDGTNPTTANALTRYTYDTQDHLTNITDANNGETTYEYDDLGNLLRRTSPDTGTTTYQHDEAGNVIQAVDAKSQVFTYVYDVFNRLTSINVDGTVDDATYTYDSCSHGFGRLCKTLRNNSQLSYQYNAFGEVTNLSQSIITWAGYNKADNNISYDYDEAGHIKNITYPSGAVINYTYNAAGKVDNANLDQNGIVKTLSLSVNYLPFGEESIQTYGNGMNVMGFYDQAYRPFIVGDPSLYFEYVSAYDANGNIKSIRTGAQGAYTDSVFGFDEQQRLTASTGFHGDFNYNYDEVGNKLSQVENGVTTSASYSTNSNRLEALAGVATNTDANGNILNLRGMALTYTIDNRLKSTNTGASFEYHAQGQRSIKHAIAPGYAGTLSYKQSTSYVYGLRGELLAEVGPTGSVKKEYVYLNNKLLAMLDHKPTSNEPILKADLDNDGEISVEDFLIWYFNHRTDAAYEVTGDGIANGDDITAVVNCGLTQGNCVAANFSTDIYYVHNDHLGTPKLLTNSNRQAVWSAKASPFGKTVVNNDVDGNGVALEFNIRQPGQYYDRESGLYYNYFRYYDPETGRYITSDPIGLAGGVNTYGYALNNPLKYTDPNGQSPLQIIGYGAGALLTLISIDNFYSESNETTDVTKDVNEQINQMLRDDYNGRPLDPNLDVDKLQKNDYNKIIGPIKAGKDLLDSKNKLDRLKKLIDIKKKLNYCD